LHASADHAIVVSPNPITAPGGVERMSALVARVLEARGWQVSVVCPPSFPPRSIYRVGLGSLWLSHAAARAAADVDRPKLIVTNGFLGAGFPSDIPRVHVYHGTMVGSSIATRAMMPRRELARRVIGGGLSEALSARAATVVCVSESAASEVRRYYRVRVDSVLPNAIDTAVFRPLPRAEARARLGLPEDRQIALYVGRPDRGKGFQLLPGATQRAGFELAVAGPSRFTGVHELGVLDPLQLAHAYCAADCVVLPSAYESCSYVVLEALACGVPLITTRVGWMKQLLRELPAYDSLCVRADQEQIADRLRHLPELATPDLIGQAREYVAERHGLRQYGARWDELLSRVPRSSEKPR
jgi:glycosyltransferase involved in cell wall biosynthesis